MRLTVSSMSSTTNPTWLIWTPSALNLSVGAMRLEETKVETVGRANNAPSTPKTASHFFDLKPKKRGVESCRHVKISDGYVDVINASRVHGCGRTQSGTSFAGLNVHGS